MPDILIRPLLTSSQATSTTIPRSSNLSGHRTVRRLPAEQCVGKVFCGHSEKRRCLLSMGDTKEVSTLGAAWGTAGGLDVQNRRQHRRYGQRLALGEAQLGQRVHQTVPGLKQYPLRVRQTGAE